MLILRHTISHTVIRNRCQSDCCTIVVGNKMTVTIHGLTITQCRRQEQGFCHCIADTDHCGAVSRSNDTAFGQHGTRATTAQRHTHPAYGVTFSVQHLQFMLIPRHTISHTIIRNRCQGSCCIIVVSDKVAVNFCTKPIIQLNC